VSRGGWDREAADVARRETLDRLHTMLAEQVGSLESTSRWEAWLRFAHSFHRYSFSNTLLIMAQRPDATMVSGYRSWQARGRQVRRGETAIRVLGPVTRRVELLDPNGRPLLDERGKPRTHVDVVGVKPVSVFDVSSTDGEPLPVQPQAQLLTGQAPPGLWESLTALIEAEGFTVSRGDCGGANGMTMFDTREVRVRADVDDAQSCKTLCHEAAHVLLHADLDKAACRGVREVEAEGVAHLVTAAHDLDSSQYTFNYVAGWAHQATPPGGNVADVVRATGQRVIATAARILRTTQPHADTTPAEDLEPTGRALDRRPVAIVADAPAVWERTDRLVRSGADVERRIPPTLSPMSAVGVRR